MSMNIDAHKARMLANGNSTGEALGNSTKSSINYLFKDSPFYRVVQINGIDTEVRVSDKNVNISGISSNQKDLTFRPDTKVNIGGLVEFDNKSWYLVDFNNNDIFPTGSIKFCNSTLKWKDTLGTIYSQPCIIENRLLHTTLDTDKYMTIPDGNIIVTTQYNADAKTIKFEHSFIFGSQVFSVEGYDDASLVQNDSGLIIFNMKFKQYNISTDDFVDNIADNDDLDDSHSSGGGGVLF